MCYAPRENPLSFTCLHTLVSSPGSPQQQPLKRQPTLLTGKLQAQPRQARSREEVSRARTRWLGHPERWRSSRLSAAHRGLRENRQPVFSLTDMLRFPFFVTSRNGVCHLSRSPGRISLFTSLWGKILSESQPDGQLGPSSPNDCAYTHVRRLRWDASSLRCCGCGEKQHRLCS